MDLQSYLADQQCIPIRLNRKEWGWIGETTTHLDVIWDPANFRTGLRVSRAKTCREGVGSLLCSLSSCSSAELCGNKGRPAPPTRDPCHVSMGAGTERVLRVWRCANPPGEAAAPEMPSQQEVNKELFRLTKDAHGTSPRSTCHV